MTRRELILVALGLQQTKLTNPTVLKVLDPDTVLWKGAKNGVGTKNS